MRKVSGFLAVFLLGIWGLCSAEQDENIEQILEHVIKNYNELVQVRPEHYIVPVTLSGDFIDMTISPEILKIQGIKSELQFREYWDIKQKEAIIMMDDIELPEEIRYPIKVILDGIDLQRSGFIGIFTYFSGGLKEPLEKIDKYFQGKIENDTIEIFGKSYNTYRIKFASTAKDKEVKMPAEGICPLKHKSEWFLLAIESGSEMVFWIDKDSPVIRKIEISSEKPVYKEIVKLDYIHKEGIWLPMIIKSEGNTMSNTSKFTYNNINKYWFVKEYLYETDIGMKIATRIIYGDYDTVSFLPERYYSYREELEEKAKESIRQKIPRETQKIKEKLDSNIKLISASKKGPEGKKESKEYEIKLEYTNSLGQFKIDYHRGENITLSNNIEWKDRVVLPKKESQLILFGDIELGNAGSKIRVVLFFPGGWPEQEGLGSGYEIYVDKNHDDVFDEEGKSICKNPYSVIIDNINVLYQGGKVGEYSMSIQALYYNGRYSIGYHRVCAMEGAFSIGTKKYHAVLIDEGTNGLYDDFENNYRKDSVLVIPYKNDILDFSKRKNYSLDSTILIEEIPLKISYVSPEGGLLRLREVGYGYIKGVVKNLKNDDVIKGAKITVKAEGIDLFAKSDEEGNFNFKLGEGRYKVASIAEGFLPVPYVDVEIKESEEVICEVNLLPLMEEQKLKKGVW